MAIINLVKDWGVEPSIVRMASTDTYAVITAPGYLTAQASNIIAINAGAFDWAPTDIVLAVIINTAVVPNTYSWSFFNVSPDFTTLIPMPTIQQVVQVSSTIMTAAQVDGAYAAPVQLIPAPGAGKAIMVLASELVTEVSTVFAGGGVVHIQYDSTVHGGGANALDGTTPAAEITAASSQIYTQYGLPTTTVTTGITNKGIFF